jgi:uncharacterized protein
MKALAAFLAALSAVAALAATPVPKLATRVTDLAGTLSATQRDALESKLAAFEKQRGSQVAVLIVPTIGDETIEEFAGRVTDEWKLGRKGVDDGVLFAIAMKERRMRIHTGRGVQGTLTDALSKRIISDIVSPRFSQRRFRRRHRRRSGRHHEGDRRRGIAAAERGAIPRQGRQHVVLR